MINQINASLLTDKVNVNVKYNTGFFFQRNFDRYWDKDKNGLLTEDEISRIFHERTFLNSACIVGLIRSCDTDRTPGINRQEWYTCLKTEGIRHIPFNSLS